MSRVDSRDLPIWAEMMSGKPYDAAHPALIRSLEATREALYEYNVMKPSQTRERDALLCSLLGSCGSNLHVNQPIHFDYGCNIHVGDNVYVNFNLTVLDEGRVEIGSNVFIGPNVSILTACHPLEADERDRGVQWAEGVAIGDSVWIGAGATILPGVTIGSRSVVGAGAVVTRDVPPGVVVAGNPARIIRHIDREP